MNYFFTGLISLLSFTGIAQPLKSVFIEKDEPAWLKKIAVDANVNTPPDNTGGYYYLLINVQDNVETEHRFIHYAVKVINSEGIQSISDISTSYDPDYQKLIFHKIVIHRNGKSIDKLNGQKIETYQRETNMERHLYDGTLTAVVNLTDIREGDVIEYSYSRIGKNPVFQGKYFEKFNFEYSIPVNKIHYSVNINPRRKLHFKYFNGASKPSINKSENGVSYSWDYSDVRAVLYDVNVPAWYDQEKSVAVSEYPDWNAIVDWALPLYELESREIESVKNIMAENIKTTDRNLQIVNAIRLVQDEIRYLGFESGLSACKPNRPELVLERRFGDCKDKSLLLVAALRSLGLEANPLLVNSQRTFAIEKDLPSPASFDHCVVHVKWNDKEVYIDPTLSSQGGSWDSQFFPEYQVGLLIKPGTSELRKLTASDHSKTVLKEIITAKDYHKPATYLVRTEYYGSRADFQRAFFKNNSKDYINKEYLNFYSRIYPEIKSVKEINFLDYERNSENRIIIEEEYEIQGFWETSEENTDLFSSRVYALVLENLVDVPKTSARNMPYYLGAPTEFLQETVIELPDDWQVENSKLEFRSDAFAYNSKVVKGAKSIMLTFDYKTFRSYIDADQVKEFISLHEKIKGDLSFFLNYDKSVESFRFSWFSLVLLIISVGAGLYFARKLYFEYNPDSPINTQNPKPIGGWLILVAIGISISPFRILYNVVSTQEYFNHNLWIGLFDSEKSVIIPELAALLVFELVYNTLIFIYIILVLILFYKKRTSLPRLISIFYAVNLVVIVIDTVLALGLMPNVYSEQEKVGFYKNIVGSLIACAIWIPYFTISQRVKETFTVKLSSIDDEKEELDYRNQL